MTTDMERIIESEGIHIERCIVAAASGNTAGYHDLKRGTKRG